MNEIDMTEAAQQKVRALREDDGNPNLMLRVYVTGGRCSGFSYGFRFAEEVGDEDARFDFEDVAVLIDSLSYTYLEGSKIDYTQGLDGARFIIDNPNATTTCGCGSSFSI